MNEQEWSENPKMWTPTTDTFESFGFLCDEEPTSDDDINIVTTKGYNIYLAEGTAREWWYIISRSEFQITDPDTIRTLEKIWEYRWGGRTIPDELANAPLKLPVGGFE